MFRSLWSRLVNGRRLPARTNKLRSRQPTCGIRPYLELLECRILLSVQFTIDPLQDVKSISPYIYGINHPLAGYSNYTYQRLGGDLTTDWNWTNGDSNAGSDYYFQNESLSYFTGGTNGPGGAAIPIIQSDAAQGAATLLTIPINGYVAANTANDDVLSDPVTTVTGSVSATATVIPVANAAAIPSTPYYIVIDSEEMEVTAVNLANNQLTVVRGISGPSAAPQANDPVYLSPDVRNAGANYLQTQFDQELPMKPGAPGSFTLTPDPNSPTVYADEFVNWVNTMYPYGETSSTTPIWYQLDNEPDLWAYTHAEIQPTPTTYAEVLQDSIEYSEAIKSVEPNALVFGPASYGWEGYTSLQGAPDADGRDWLDYYLQQMNQASVSAGERLLDVLDVHFYTSTPDDPADIVQAPRSLWDPTYMENSWIAQNIPGPIELLPRLQADINQFYPGTKLSISEYNYGGGDEIAGAIAEADALGIFGEQGVYAASEWQLASNESYIAAAFNMYRDFDGNDGTFGDTSVFASTSDATDSSIYASVDSSNTNVMTLVAINKSTQAQMATMQLDHVQPGATAAIYQLTSASTTPQYAGTVTISDPADFTYTMPGYSVTTIRIISPSGQGIAPTVATAAQAAPATVAGISTALSVLGADAAGAANLTYTWAVIGTPPAPVSFSVNGSNAARDTVATFSAPGSYTFVATITNADGFFATSTVTVVVDATLSAIMVTPGDPTMAANAAQQFTATSTDQFGDTLANPTYTWSASAGSISSTGVFSAPANTASVTVSASADGVEGSTTVSVVNQTTVIVDEATDASLRNAIATANAEAEDGDSVTVLFAATLAGDTINLTQGLLEIAAASGTVTIDGGSLITISGGGQTVFQVDNDAQAVLYGLTIEDGNAGSSGSGGGITNAGTLLVSDFALLDNTAGASGGGIDNSGTLTVSNVTFTGNTAGAGGGGLDNEQGATLAVAGATFSTNSAPNGGGLNNDGTATIVNSTFSANAATGTGTNGNGGGIANSGTLTLMATVVIHNSSTLAGGGIYSTGPMTVWACTIDDNDASYIAGGINNVGTMTVANSTLAGNYSYLGGGIYNGNYYSLSGDLTLTNDTITSNFAAYGAGGGIYMANGGYSNDGPSKLTLRNTIVAGNYASGNSSDPLSNPVLPFGPDIQVYSGTVSGADNLIGDGQGLTGITNDDANHNQVGTPTAPIDPLLAAPLNTALVPESVTSPIVTFNQALIPLADNGGATPTIALNADSPAIGAGGAITTLAAAVGSAKATTITVLNAAAIAATDPPAGSGYVIVIGSEAMLVTANDGNKLTVVRGYDGTTATTHGGGASVFLGADQRGLIAPTATPDIGAYQTPIHLVVLSNPSDHTADAGQTVTLTASVRGVNVSVQWQLSTNGGASWSDIAGATGKSVVTSNGLSIATTTLSISATLAKNGNQHRVHVTSPAASLYTNAAQLFVNPALALGSMSTTQWTEGLTGFSGTMAIGGGTAPYTIKTATGMPAGLTPSITASAVSFSGTPTKAGTFQVTVTLVDGAGATVTRTFALTINRSLAFTLVKLPAYTLNVSYAQTIGATGGTGPVTLTYSLDNSLPAGLAITPASPAIGSFKIKGKPTSTATVHITVTATDRLGATFTATFVLAS